MQTCVAIAAMNGRPAHDLSTRVSTNVHLFTAAIDIVISNTVSILYPVPYTVYTV